jgi:hypothetical protein
VIIVLPEKKKARGVTSTNGPECVCVNQPIKTEGRAHFLSEPRARRNMHEAIACAKYTP